MWIGKSFDSDEFIFFKNKPERIYEEKGYGHGSGFHWVGEYDNWETPYTNNPEIGRLDEYDLETLFPELYEAYKKTEWGEGLEYDLVIKGENNSPFVFSNADKVVYLQ